MATAFINFLLNIFDTNHTEDFRVLYKRKIEQVVYLGYGTTVDRLTRLV